MAGAAARVGDGTSHRGRIAGPGCLSVLIGGRPAARMSDLHVCPMVTAAPTPVPHLGGPVIGPGVTNVWIGGLPAVTVGDMAICIGPPDVITQGCSKVLIGSGSGLLSGGLSSISGAIATKINALSSAVD